MQVINGKTLSKIDMKLLSLVSRNTDEICFFDIETTGFSRAYNICYLIGVVYFRDKQAYYTQWLAERDKDEPELLAAFNTFMSDYRYVIHFNGDAFDIPFVTQRAAHNGVTLDLSHMESLDLLKITRKCKKFLGLPDYKQKSVERFLGIEREDMCNGGELIEVYKRFVRLNDSPEKEKLKNLLLLHNHDDIEGMPLLLPIITYYSVIQEAFQYKNFLLESSACGFAGSDNSSNSLKDSTVSDRHLTLSCLLPAAVPVDKTFDAGSITVNMSGEHLYIHIPVLSSEMKHFYRDYKDYFYLPAEDTAIHKSVAQFVDSGSKEPCCVSNCYTKKQGAYIPAYPEITLPVFKKDYADDAAYFNIDDVLNSDVKSYCLAVINNMSI